MKITSKTIIGALIGATLIAGTVSAVAVTTHVVAATAIEYGVHANPYPTAVEY